MANDPTQFKPGDVVRLKAGGPAMTVERSETSMFVACAWFTRDGEFHREVVAEVILVPATPDAWEPEPPAETLFRSGFR
jgi:uncharacterized protein YodC (DUF2158 family)